MAKHKNIKLHEDKRHQLINRTLSMIMTNGFHTFSLNQLLKDVQMSKGSFFHYFKSKKELDKYTSKDQIMHGGYIAEVEHIDQPDLKEFIKGKNKLTFVCIDEVTDPRNIGSLIRSASSFHIDGLIVKERQFPSDSKLMYKAASGCMEHINIFEVANINSTLKNLREKNFWVYGFDARGEKDFTDIKWEGKNVLLFGSEGFGMREHTGKYTDFFVKININKDVESLNISNSAAIVFHHLSYLKKNS